MAKRTGTAVRKTRHLKKKHVRKKGKLSITQYFQEFNPGDKVVLVYEPSVHEGLYHRRFYGKVGQVIAKQGKCYVVKINDFNREKKLIVHPVHLKKL